SLDLTKRDLMSLQGKTDDEIRAMHDALIQKVKDLGGSAGNNKLIRELGWDEDDYWIIRDRVVDLGSLRRYRARGGAVAIVPPPVAAEKTVANEQEAPQNFECPQPVEPAERDLYEPVATVLRGAWAKDSRFRHHVVEITASQGRRNTGGTWTRPDIVVAALRVFPFLPGKFFDLITFEIKPSWALNVTAVYEALAHRRAATQSYVWLHSADIDADAEAIDRITEEAERHGIGLIVATDPNDYNSWDIRVDPSRVEPDPEVLNEFIALQISDGAKDELAAWVR
ncbi:hypothetical protein ACFO6X_15840, partial [Giesbergeria sinuosa]